MITLHHLSATGGTIITKILSTSDDFFVLNEKHPYFLYTEDQNTFSPTRVMGELYSRYSAEIFKDKDISLKNKILSDLFLSELKSADHIAKEHNKTLLIRDWSHNDFLQSNSECKGALHELLKNTPDIDVTAKIVTIRNPIDSYLSCLKTTFIESIDNNWELYCNRSIMFYEYYKKQDCNIFKYEEIIKSPGKFIDEISALTGASFPTNYQERVDRYSFSGDSGRKSSKIGIRTTRREDIKLRNRLMTTDCYKKAEKILNY